MIALQTSADYHSGLAISPDSAHMVTSHDNDTLSVYSLPGGEHIRTFGSEGAGKGQFSRPAKLCFSATGNILVADYVDNPLQELTLTGDHVRFIGVGVIDDPIRGIAANTELIVVAKCAGACNGRIMLFDAVTGAFARAFGCHGDSPGQLLEYCNGIRFTPDGSHIVVAESDFDEGCGRLSLFTVAGEYVKCFGEEDDQGALCDIECVDRRTVAVSDYHCNRVCVYSVDGGTLLRQWGDWGDADGKFKTPTALATCGGQLYVLDEKSKRVQVFG